MHLKTGLSQYRGEEFSDESSGEHDKKSRGIIRKYFKNFFNKFTNQGLNIHDPKYGSWVEKTKHLNEAWNFNKDWEIWIGANPNATLAMVLAKAKELTVKYGYEIFF